MAQGKRWYILAISLFLMDIFLCATVYEEKYDLPKLVKYIFSLGSIVTITYVCLSNKVKQSESGQKSKVLLFFTLWTLFLLASSPYENLMYFQKVFAARYYFLPFLIPILVMSADLDPEYYISILRLTKRLLVILIGYQLFIIITGLNFETWYEQSQILSMLQLGSALLLFVSHLYKNTKLSIAIVTSYIFLLFIYSYWGRRGISIEIFLTLILFACMRLSTKYSNFNVKKSYIASIFLLIAGAIVIFTTYASELYVFQRGIDFSSVMFSRDNVWIDFFTDFTKTQDWVFGRGLNGTIKRSIILSEIGETIETGYLYYLLKGGLLYLVPLLVIFFRAIYLGLFRSKNDLSKAFALIILIQLYNMAAFGLPDFSSKYSIVWLCVSGCFSWKLRNIDNNELMYKLIQRG